MNNLEEKEGLLRDVLGEDGFAARREVLLGDMLRLVRRRRRLRQARQTALLIALLAAAVLLTRLPHHPPAETRLAAPKTCELVETKPLRAEAIVETKALSPAQVVETIPTASIVTTAANKFHLEEINDEALLAMAAPNPAVLVRRGDGKAELIFVQSDRDAADEKTNF